MGKSESPPSELGFRRPYRDSVFAFLFLATVLTTFALAILASTQSRPLNLDARVRLAKFNPATNKCDIVTHPTPLPDPDSDSAFVSLATVTSLSALALTLPVSLVLFSLLRRFPQTMLLLSTPLLSLLPLGCCVVWFSWCLGVEEGCTAVCPRARKSCSRSTSRACQAVLAYELWKNWTGRSTLPLAVEVVRMATGALQEHFLLLVVNPVLLLATMVLVNGPILTFMWYAFNVGEVVPDFDVVNDPAKGCGRASGVGLCVHHAGR